MTSVVFEHDNSNTVLEPVTLGAQSFYIVYVVISETTFGRLVMIHNILWQYEMT